MKSIKNEYRINFYNDSISKNIQRVFIYADNDFQAMDIVMNTYNIPKNWIVNSSLWRKNVPVKIKGKNIYQYKKRERKYSDYDIQMNNSLLLDKIVWY